MYSCNGFAIQFPVDISDERNSTICMEIKTTKKKKKKRRRKNKIEMSKIVS